MQSQRRILNFTSRLSKYLHRLQHQQRLLETSAPAAENAVPLPPKDGEEKVYSEKIHRIVDDISKLNLLEVSDLNSLLKKTLKIQDAPIMAHAAAMPMAASKVEEEEELPVKKEKMSFSVKMTGFDASKKVAIIKGVKELIPGLNLVQTKKFIESLPQVIKADLPKEEAEELKKKLEELGATAETD